MRTTKKSVEVKVLTGKAAQAVWEQWFQLARARLASRIQQSNLSEEEIMAEILAFRARPASESC